MQDDGANSAQNNVCSISKTWQGARLHGRQASGHGSAHPTTSPTAAGAPARLGASPAAAGAPAHPAAPPAAAAAGAPARHGAPPVTSKRLPHVIVRRVKVWKMLDPLSGAEAPAR